MEKFIKIVAVLIMTMGIVYSFFIGAATLSDYHKAGFDNFDLVSVPIDLVVISGPFLFGIFLFFIAIKFGNKKVMEQ